METHFFVFLSPQLGLDKKVHTKTKTPLLSLGEPCALASFLWEQQSTWMYSFRSVTVNWQTNHHMLDPALNTSILIGLLALLRP